jgi:adenosylcobinamide-GDP ribazoletransferase
LRALLSFFTILPVRGGSLREAAAAVPFLPLVGLLTGAPGAAILVSGVFPPSVAAALALAAALLAAGLHHADGVLDVGDALMVRGSRERRREVLKDARVGVGGLAALFVVYAPTLAALSVIAEFPARAAVALLAAEVAHRSAILLLLAFGRPASEGSSSVVFIQALRGGRRVPGILLALVAPVALLAPVGASALLAALAVPAIVLMALKMSGSAFGGISGDVAGATGEVTRVTVLVVLSVTI